MKPGPLVFPWQSSCAIVLVFLLATMPSLNAQTPASASPVKLPPTKLTIFVLGGKDAVNFIPDRRGTTPIVEIRDENEYPVEGADVRFELPASGPGGVFANGTHTLTVKTNVDGQAAAPFVVNTIEGAFEIKVTATLADHTGTAVIAETNSLEKPEDVNAKKSRPLYRNWKFWAVVAGGVTAAAIIVAVRGSGSKSTSNPTITLSPGTPTVGAP